MRYMGIDMKKRDIILDFTSLLDITLIVIFFFVLFSHLDSEEKKAITEAKVKELATAIEKADAREANAEELVKQLEQEIQIVREADERQAANVEGLLSYRKSGNIKMILIMQENGWLVRVQSKQSVVAELDAHAQIGEQLIAAIQAAGYDVEDTILCDFIFDGLLPGTASAYRTITKGLHFVEKEYPFLYYSETDLSIGEE